MKRIVGEWENVVELVALLCVYTQKLQLVNVFQYFFKSFLECLHEAITHDLYELPNPPKCDPQGNYAQVQCNQKFCYCVVSETGIEIPRTRVPLGLLPNCSGFFFILFKL